MSEKFVQLGNELIHEDGVIFGQNGQTAIVVHHIVGDDGLTDKERNLKLTHKIPVYTMVEVTLNDDDVANGLRLYVHSHTRDCDGTPLYNLTADIEAMKSLCTQEAVRNKECRYERYFATIDIGKIITGYSESCLVEYKSAEIIKNKLIETGYMDTEFNCIY